MRLTFSLAVGIAVVLALVASACGTARDAKTGEPTTCDRCHAGGPLASTASDDPRIGGHRAHLDAGLGCAECHVLPSRASDHGAASAGVRFGAIARANGAQPTYDPATLTCSATWCHAGVGGGAVPRPRWDQGALAAPEARCGACHGAPPPVPHPPAAWRACDRCHPGTVTATGGIVANGRHVDGHVDASRFHPAGWIGAHGAEALRGADSCRGCHGPDLLDPASPLSCTACHGADGSVSCGACHGAPPPTGAHAAHRDPAAAPPTTYGSLASAAGDAAARRPRFECGHCHPTDHARHLDGELQVDLSPASGAGSLKALNDAAAAWDAGAKTCSGVYCHSSGQASPAFRATPAWNGPGGLGCGGCHGNPPRYASGGPASATANSHLWASNGFAAGHFGGWPAWGHGGDHQGTTGAGAQTASIVSCQTCHFATVDPGNSGASGFYYLDTTIDLDLGAGVVTTRCADCHGAANGPPARGGATLAARHVNGERDVVFDPRTEIPAGTAGIPAAPNRPAFPYWRTNAGITLPQGVDAVQTGTTLSAHVANARWDAATKTCSSVSCHLSATQPVVWGDTTDIEAACLRCHQF